MPNYRVKTIPQGSATSVWAAIGKDLEGKGGEYLEDAGFSHPRNNTTRDGYAAYAYDDDLALNLWEYSEKVVHA